jgi:hypothetical protein
MSEIAHQPKLEQIQCKYHYPEIFTANDTPLFLPLHQTLDAPSGVYLDISGLHQMHHPVSFVISVLHHMHHPVNLISVVLHQIHHQIYDLAQAGFSFI